jgi:hypothetical protein
MKTYVSAAPLSKDAAKLLQDAAAAHQLVQGIATAGVQPRVEIRSGDVVFAVSSSSSTAIDVPGPKPVRE